MIPTRHSGGAGLPLSGCFRAPQGVRSHWFGTRSDGSCGQTVRQGGRSTRTEKSRYTQTSEKITGSRRQSHGFQDSGTQTVPLESTGSTLSGKSHELIPRKSQNAAIKTFKGTGVLGETFEGADIRQECMITKDSGSEGVSYKSVIQKSKFESNLNP